MSNNSINQGKQFPTTCWSDITQAGGSPKYRQLALTGFLQRYRQPLITYLEYRNSIPQQDIEDLVHGFIADKIIGDNLILYAQKERGRFRNFLLSSFKNYIASHFRKENIVQHTMKSDSTTDGNIQTLKEQSIDPSMVFDIAWAQQVTTEALDNLQEEYETNGRLPMWKIFQKRILIPAFTEEPIPTYQELVDAGLITDERQGRNWVVNAKRAYKRHLLSIITEYVGNEDAQLEINTLQDVLSRYIHTASMTS